MIASILFGLFAVVLILIGAAEVCCDEMRRADEWEG